MKLLKKQRENLLEKYADKCVEDMDMKTLMQSMIERIIESFDSDDDEYLIAQVEEFYPELLDELNINQN